MGSVGNGLAEFSPSVRLFIAAFWVAWITIIYSGDCIVVPALDSYSTTSSAFLTSTFAFGVTLLAAGLAPAPFERFLANAKALVAAGVLAGIATVGISFEGMLPAPVFFASAACCGVLTSVLALLGGVVYSEVDTKHSVIASCFSLAIGVLIYALASMCAIYYTPASVLAITATLPLAGILLALVPVDAEKPLVDDAARALSPALWRVLAFCGILIFALSTVRGYFPQLIDPTGFAASRAATALGLIAAALLVMLLAARMPRNGSFSGFFYWLIVGAVVAILPISLLGLASPLSGALGGVANGVVCMATWCLLADISHRTGMSPVRVMGFGYSVVAIMMTVGFFVGSIFGDFISAQYSYISGFAFLVACVVCAVALLQRKALDELAEPTPAVLSALGQNGVTGSSASGEELEQEPRGNVHAVAIDAQHAVGGKPPSSSECGTDGETEARRPGKFIQKCNRIAEDFGLSSRETEVFILLAKHMEAKAIAEELFISFNTARTHIQKVYGKLDVHSRRELLELVDNYKG